jgi:aspartyl-tRNA(Asn)/glutamyl-tRNA(Gln) amidotransferase subunit C
MNISVEDIKHLTRLSKLHFNQVEAGYYVQDLKRIIEYVEKLNEIDLEEITPTAHILPIKNVFREDEVKQSMAVSEILKNAPDAQEDCFHVPQVVEG